MLSRSRRDGWRRRCPGSPGCPRDRPRRPRPRWPPASSTPRCAPRSPPSATGWSGWAGTAAATRGRGAGSCWVAAPEGSLSRFVLVARPGMPPSPTGNDNPSLVAVVGDRTGALLELLSEFAVRGISLTRIESRPTRERLGVYSFPLDCEGHIADRRVGEALTALHRLCDDVRFLGSYP